MGTSPLQQESSRQIRFDSTPPGLDGSKSSVLSLKQRRSFKRCEKGVDVFQAVRAMAKLGSMDERESFLLRHYDPDFHDLIWASFPSAMASEILGMSTVQERRLSLEGLPEEHRGKPVRKLCELIVRHQWHQRKR